ncbi:hypothetical protein [Haloplanus sp.]|uniref:hypothetical protein n=1 Tax=Haloplanus sp. TaxID=1961696 RepID=UPI00260AF8D9|nr:hypothetical protein [Haloplanus sp.]
MSGLVTRIREWVGSLFGGADENDTAADEPRTERGGEKRGGGPDITHRDDRPLETPDVSPRAANAVTASEPEPETAAGAVTSQDDPPKLSTDAGSGSVVVTGPEAGTESAGQAGPDDRNVPTDDPATGAGNRTNDASGTPATDTASTFECAVCGTGVDGPAHSCPLCRSDEVVPVTESPRRES